MPAFAVSLVSRVPASSGAPALVEVDRLVTSSVTYVDELNRPGSATVNCPVRSLSDAVKGRLADLRSFPSEVWVYVESTLAWAGEVRSLGISGQTVQLNCVGLLGYLSRMGITADVTHTGADQFTIGKGLVNTWQALSYGNYGLVTSGIGTSGVTRDRTYLYRDQKTVLAALTDLGAVIDGFDLWVNPSSRALEFAYPGRGTDLTASVVVDARSITSASVAQSVAPDDLVSDVGALGVSQDDLGASVHLYSYRENATLQAVYGRSWRGQSFDNVSEQHTLDGKGDAFLAARGQQLLQPGVTLRPNVGAGVTLTGIRPGDTVAYAYDAGLGVQSGDYRVSKVSVTVDEGGSQSMSLEFA